MNKKKPRLHRAHHEAIPNPTTFPGMEAYYELYRMSMAMASAPDPLNVPPTSAIANKPFMVPYTEEDARIIELARKLNGFPKQKNLAPGASSEMPDTNTRSPFNTRANKGRRK
jgi:hypothetical protein